MSNALVVGHHIAVDYTNDESAPAPPPGKLGWDSLIISVIIINHAPTLILVVLRATANLVCMVKQSRQLPHKLDTQKQKLVRASHSSATTCFFLFLSTINASNEIAAQIKNTFPDTFVNFRDILDFAGGEWGPPSRLGSFFVSSFKQPIPWGAQSPKNVMRNIDY